MQALFCWQVSPSCYFSPPTHCFLCLLQSHYFPDFPFFLLFAPHLGSNELIWSISRPFPDLLQITCLLGWLHGADECLRSHTDGTQILGFWLICFVTLDKSFGFKHLFFEYGLYPHMSVFMIGPWQVIQTVIFIIMINSYYSLSRKDVGNVILYLSQPHQISATIIVL